MLGEVGAPGVPAGGVGLSEVGGRVEFGGGDGRGRCPRVGWGGGSGGRAEAKAVRGPGGWGWGKWDHLLGETTRILRVGGGDGVTRGVTLPLFRRGRGGVAAAGAR